MEDKQSPEVASFLIRFVQDQPLPEGGVSYRGVVRYVQTEEEIFFTRWDEVEAFIQQVVPLESKIENKGENHEIEG